MFSAFGEALTRSPVSCMALVTKFWWKMSIFTFYELFFHVLKGSHFELSNITVCAGEVFSVLIFHSILFLDNL